MATTQIETVQGMEVQNLGDGEYRVTRPSGSPHVVTVRNHYDRETGGYSWSARCECRGYRFRRGCRHHDAVVSLVMSIEDDDLDRLIS